MSEEHGGQEPSEDGLDDELGFEDDDGETGESEFEPELELPPPEPAPEPQPVSRETRRIRALRQREKDAQAEAARLRQQNELLISRLSQQQISPPPDPYRQADLDRQEAERLMMMQPHEVAQYYATRERQRTDQQLARLSVETADRLDRITWDQIKSREGAARRLDSQVEQYLAAERNQGRNPSREQIYNAIVGYEIRSKSSRQIEQQRRTGARRIASQRTNGTGARSTAPGRTQAGRGTEDNSIEAVTARLRGMTVGQFTGDA